MSTPKTPKNDTPKNNPTLDELLKLDYLIDKFCHIRSSLKCNYEKNTDIFMTNYAKGIEYDHIIEDIKPLRENAVAQHLCDIKEERVKVMNITAVEVAL